MCEICRISLDEMSDICYPRITSRRPLMSFLTAIELQNSGGHRSGVPAYIFHKTKSNLYKETHE